MTPLDTAERTTCPVCGEALLRPVREIRLAAQVCDRITARARACHTLAALESIADSLRVLARMKETG